MKQYRLLFQLAVSMPRTGEIESSLWATPNTLDGMVAKSQEDLEREATSETERKGRTSPGNLRDQVAVSEGQRMWPTPSANEDAAGTVNGKMQRMLTHAAKESVMFLTPKATEPQAGDASLTRQEAGIGGQLNPMWVEWLMGFPLEWTDLDALETQ